MSFSREVKEELAGHTGGARHCQLAELAAIMSFSGQYGRDGEGLYTIGFQLENEDVLRKGFTLLEKTYNIEKKIGFTQEEMQDFYHNFEGLPPGVCVYTGVQGQTTAAGDPKVCHRGQDCIP